MRMRNTQYPYHYTKINFLSNLSFHVDNQVYSCQNTENCLLSCLFVITIIMSHFTYLTSTNILFEFSSKKVDTLWFYADVKTQIDQSQNGFDIEFFYADVHTQFNPNLVFQ